MGADPRIVFTDERCVIDGRPFPGVPIFFAKDGVLQFPSDYMVFLRKDLGCPPGTIETYAYHVRKYLRHIAKLGLQLPNATDEVLVRWRDRMLQVEKLDPKTVGSYLGTVFHMYEWGELTGRLFRSVACYDDVTALDAGGQRPLFRISAQRNKRGTGWRWPYLPRPGHKARRHTPTQNEIQALHVQVYERASKGPAASFCVAERDTLLLKSYEELYLRRGEALALRLGMIPDLETIYQAKEHENTLPFRISGKRGITRTVHMSPELAEEFLDYIDGCRAEVVRRVIRRRPGYVEPDRVFISHTTGMPLCARYVSQRISGLMRESGGHLEKPVPLPAPQLR